MRTCVTPVHVCAHRVPCSQNKDTAACHRFTESKEIYTETRSIWSTIATSSAPISALLRKLSRVTPYCSPLAPSLDGSTSAPVASARRPPRPSPTDSARCAGDALRSPRAVCTRCHCSRLCAAPRNRGRCAAGRWPSDIPSRSATCSRAPLDRSIGRHAGS